MNQRLQPVLAAGADGRLVRPAGDRHARWRGRHRSQRGVGKQPGPARETHLRRVGPPKATTTVFENPNCSWAFCLIPGTSLPAAFRAPENDETGPDRPVSNSG
jgi:hypothetical protein